MAFDFSTLVTDRKQSDVAYVKQLISKIVEGTATEAELAEWKSFTLKGSYNYTDLNRVNAAMEQLKAQLEGYGYAVPGYRKVQIPHTKIPSSRLPSGYTELKYIESTGTQYINTGFNPNQNTRVVMDVQATAANTYAYFGGRNGSQNKSMTFFMMSATKVRSDYGATEIESTVSNPTSRVVIDVNKNVFNYGGVTGTHKASTFQSDYTLYLLAVHNGGTASYPMPAKLYSCRIYDNGNLIRDYVPCINPDGNIGLYDTVNKKFYGNAGTGSFIGGAVVEWDAIGDEQIDYDPYLWYEVDIPTSQLMENYLANVQSVRNVLELFDSTPATPDSMSGLTYNQANAIEQILFDIDKAIKQTVGSFVRLNAFTAVSGNRPLPSVDKDIGRTWAELDAMQTIWRNWDVATWFLLLHGNLTAVETEV